MPPDDRRGEYIKMTVFDERNGLEYELEGKQYYPTGQVMKNGVMTPLKIPEENEAKKEKYIGVWGHGSLVEISAAGRSADRCGRRDQWHLRYIRQYNKRLYLNLYIPGTLNAISQRLTRKRRFSSSDQ